MIVSGEHVAQWIGARLGISTFPPFVGIGIERDSEIVGGVLLNCFEDHDLHLTAVGRGWGKDFLREVGEYVYGALGCLRMTIVTEHEDVARLACKLGGEREGLMRNHFGVGRNAIIVGILREHWKYGSFAEFQRG